MVNFAAAGGIISVHYLVQNSGELFSGYGIRHQEDYRLN